jgi:hypothetical protein
MHRTTHDGHLESSDETEDGEDGSAGSGQLGGSTGGWDWAAWVGRGCGCACGAVDWNSAVGDWVWCWWCASWWWRNGGLPGGWWNARWRAVHWRALNWGRLEMQSVVVRWEIAFLSLRTYVDWWSRGGWCPCGRWHGHCVWAVRNCKGLSEQQKDQQKSHSMLDCLNDQYGPLQMWP